jgi:hypothetical protein
VHRHSFLGGQDPRSLEEIRMMVPHMAGMSCSPHQLVERMEQEQVGPEEKLQP